MRKSVIMMTGIMLTLIPAFAFAKGTRQPSLKVELRVLNYLDMTGVNAADEINMVWDAFEKANPDIRIIREDLFGEAFHQRTGSYVDAGQLPDVLYAWPFGRSASLHTRHLLKDLGPLVSRDGLASLYSPVALEPSHQVAGYLGMFPQGMTTTSVLYVNLEVLGECGLQPAKTYSELVAQVPILRARGYETVLMANRETWVMQSCLFSLVAGRFCGEGWEQRILSGEAKFTDSDFVAALNCIKAMYDDGVLRRTSISASYGDVVGQFAANKGAYYIEGDWGVAAFVTNATGQALISPDRQRNIQITVFPDIDLPGVKFNRSSSVVLGAGWGISAAIPAGSPREEAAWRLVKWLAGREVLAWRVQTGGVLAPSRIDIDMTNLMLQPMQAAIGNLGREYDRGTVVIDAVFDGPVYAPLNDGLQAIGMGRQSPQQVAQVVQAAFDAWKARR